MYVCVHARVCACTHRTVVRRSCARPCVFVRVGARLRVRVRASSRIYAVVRAPVCVRESGSLMRLSPLRLYIYIYIYVYTLRLTLTPSPTTVAPSTPRHSFKHLPLRSLASHRRRRRHPYAARTRSYIYIGPPAIRHKGHWIVIFIPR